MAEGEELDTALPERDGLIGADNRARRQPERVATH